jgi:photoactive yellow protein
VTPGGLTDLAWQQACAAATSASFASAEALAALEVASAEELDTVAIAVIEVDDRGVVRSFNARATALTGLPASTAVGRALCTQVLPCTDNRLFRGALTRTIDETGVDALFGYVFTYRFPNPVEARVHLHRALGRTWVLIKPR